MRTNRIALPLVLFLLVCLAAPALAASEKPEKPAKPNGCAPEYRAIYDHAIVGFKGTGDRDIVVVTDPLCWHCRLGHKLLGEYPELYRNVRLSFFPRRSFIGSDMAAWILEDSVKRPDLKKLIDYAYKDLKQPRTDDLMDARMIVLMQFTDAFPELLKGTSLPELYARLQVEHEPHVREDADLSRAVDFPGTPVLITGDTVIVGYSPGFWIKALKQSAVCK
ncbi:DsbA family protein [Pseudodesulfovibrio sp.]|uniref:DsbA family protein n=1 Tax=unclassified Pseudodesulfovibrio TaxID=2661612 RepID=UPI003B00B747